MSNISEEIVRKMDILRKQNGPPPPYLKDNEKKGHFDSNSTLT